MTLNTSTAEPSIHDLDAARSTLLRLEEPLWVLRSAHGYSFTHQNPGGGWLAYAPAQTPGSLGDPTFRASYGLQAAYYAGAMANGIASAEMVIALGKAGLLGSFGSAGMTADRIEAAVKLVQAALPTGPYAFNLINSPNEPAMEQNAVEVFLRNQVRLIEASAYLDLTPALVQYRAAGLSLDERGDIHIANRVIAKLSRKEVAKRFLEPPSEDLLRRLVEAGKITPEQAELARRIPVADDITVEADSGGHTDNRPLVGVLPAIIALRDELQAKHNFPTAVRIGAGGGIGAPEAALAAFMMGAAYIVTGSVNQACVEAGASLHTRQLLAQAAMTDVIMAPAADMFEMGVRVQVLKRGTMFAMRGSKLFELYQRYESIEEIPPAEREKIEKQIFKRSLDEVWEDTVNFFQARDPRQIERALKDPHQKMALIFRWYLGLSSRWSSVGEAGREMDYQIWCGPSMGVFNDWVRGTPLEAVENRHVVEVASHLLTGAAYLLRVRLLQMQGVSIPNALQRYRP